MTSEVKWPARVCFRVLILYKCVYVVGNQSLCSRGHMVLSCPPLHSMRQCFGLGPRTKPEACCSAPASPERRLSLTLHQLEKHSRLVCVRV